MFMGNLRLRQLLGEAVRENIYSIQLALDISRSREKSRIPSLVYQLVRNTATTGQIIMTMTTIIITVTTKIPKESCIWDIRLLGTLCTLQFW
jgi:hypothetical protein